MVTRNELPPFYRAIRGDISQEEENILKRAQKEANDRDERRKKRQRALRNIFVSENDRNLPPFSSVVRGNLKEEERNILREAQDKQSLYEPPGGPTDDPAGNDLTEDDSILDKISRWDKTYNPETGEEEVSILKTMIPLTGIPARTARSVDDIGAGIDAFFTQRDLKAKEEVAQREHEKLIKALREGRISRDHFEKASKNIKEAIDLNKETEKIEDIAEEYTPGKIIGDLALTGVDVLTLGSASGMASAGSRVLGRLGVNAAKTSAKKATKYTTKRVAGEVGTLGAMDAAGFEAANAENPTLGSVATAGAIGFPTGAAVGAGGQKIFDKLSARITSRITSRTTSKAGRTKRFIPKKDPEKMDDELVPGIKHTSTIKSTQKPKKGTAKGAQKLNKKLIRKSGVILDESWLKAEGAAKISPSDNMYTAFTTYDNRNIDDIVENGFGVGAKTWQDLERSLVAKEDYSRNIMERVVSAYKKNGLKAKNHKKIYALLSGKKVNATTGEKKAAKEIRKVLDDTPKEVNEYRKSIGLKPIKYKKNYISQIQEESMLRELFGKKRVSDTGVSDLRKPARKINPSEKKRLNRIKNKEKDIFQIMERYSNMSGDDIYLNPHIDKLRGIEKILRKKGTDADTQLANKIDFFIRKTLIGEPGDLDKFFKVEGPRAQKFINEVSRARNLAALGGNIQWTTVTQPATIINTAATAGRHSPEGAYGWFRDTKLSEKILNTPTMRRKLAQTGGVGKTLGGDVERTTSRATNKGLEGVGDITTLPMQEMEKHLTGISVASGYKKGLAHGMDDATAMKYGEYIGQITQSMYDKYARPDKLTSRLLRGAIPFQTYAFEMWRYVRRIAGKGGGIPLTTGEKLKQATSLITGTFLYGKYANKMMNRELGTVGSVIPLVGSVVDEGINKTKEFTKKQLGMEYKSRGYQGAGRSPLAPAEEVGNLWDATKIAIEDENWEPLRNELTFWGSGLSGMGGGVQINRVVDTILAFNKGELETKRGEKVGDLEPTPWEIMRGMYGGKYNTSVGRKYIEEEIEKTSDPKMGADWNLKQYPGVKEEFSSLEYSPSTPSKSIRNQELSDSDYKEYNQKLWKRFLSGAKRLKETSWYQDASKKERKDGLSYLRRRITEMTLDEMGISKQGAQSGNKE